MAVVRIRTLFKAGLISAVIVAALAALLLIGADTQTGHRFIVNRLTKYESASGIRISIGRIDGSIYSKLTARNVGLLDQKGEFAKSESVLLDWRLSDLLSNAVSIRSVSSDQVDVSRLPNLKTTDPDDPFLPDIDISIGRFAVKHLVLAPAITGQRRDLSVAGKAEIADRRAQVALTALSGASGDTLALNLDAVPDDDRFKLAAKLAAPVGGILSDYYDLKLPIMASIDGQGGWSDWRGSLRADAGGKRLSEVALTGKSGAFTVSGKAWPSLLLDGSSARLLADGITIEGSAKFAERNADIDLSLVSSAISANAIGQINFADNGFGDFRITADLLDPGAFGGDFASRNVRLSVLLNGAIGNPLAQYQLSAAQLSMGSIGLENIKASGEGRIDFDHLKIPVLARAGRITGLNEAAGSILNQVTLNGNLALNDGTIISDDLKIQSTKLSATAVILADLPRGIFRGAIKGRINDYAIDGIGIVNVTSDVKLVPLTGGGFGMNGSITAQTVKIYNSAAQEFLGSQAQTSANFNYGRGGIFTFDNIKLNARKLRVTSGDGQYLGNGQITFNAKGQSVEYGPLAVNVTGTAADPLIRLRASRPKLGVQFANIDARIRRSNGGFAITGSGDSAYGPVSANLFLSNARGPLAITVNASQFAGINFAGALIRTNSGPFAGQLTANGRGINGDLGLTAVGRVQRVDFSGTAINAEIPGDRPITIDRAMGSGYAILYPDAPAIIGDFQVAGLHRGQLQVDTGRAKIDYQSGRGTAQIVADGNNGSSFNVAANALLTPSLYRVAMQGRVAGVPFELADPANISVRRGAYFLAPAVIRFERGRVDVTGRYGNGYELQSRFTDLDLAVFNSFAPRSGIGGLATGTFSIAASSITAMPSAELQMDVDRFTRSFAEAVSSPVNVSAFGRLQNNSGSLNALVKRSGNVIGRVQTQIGPFANGKTWNVRLMDAPLSGGIRYNGPAELLWALTGFADQEVAGPIGIAADFNGLLSQPQLNGVLRAANLTYTNRLYGTQIRAIKLEGLFTNQKLAISQFSGRAGEGTIEGSGSIGFAADSGFPIDINATLNRARLARSDELAAIASGTIRLTNSTANGAIISGDLRLPEARYRLVRQGSADIIELEGVRRKGVPVGPSIVRVVSGPPGLFKLDLRLRADNRVFVTGMGLEAEWATDLRVTGTSSAPLVTGNVDLVRGTYDFGGRRFILSNNSKITFRGGRATDPVLAITADAVVDGVTASINISGTAQEPRIAFSSVPNLPQDEILSRLLFGNSVTELSATQTLQLAASLNSLSSSGKGINPLGALRNATGIDRLRILTEDPASGRKTAVAAGQYISNDIYIEIITDGRGFTATQLEISLSKALSLLSQVGGSGGTNATLRYSKDY
jgi:translocation and assembly module TamB